MGFKENLLKKIEIDRIADQVGRSMRPGKSSDSPVRIDLASMKSLLEMGPYQHRRERDLDLYILATPDNGEDILVLDNELKIYRTAIADVALRKSPTLKEMISIRNAIKILNDKDVVSSAKAETLQRIRDQLVGNLDLSFTPADIDAISDDGAQALQNSYGEGVIESLTLFAELLEWQQAPKPFQQPHHYIAGSLDRSSPRQMVMGPLVMYDRMHNSLKMLQKRFDNQDKAAMEHLELIVRGDVKPDGEGAAVFDLLKKAVLNLDIA